MGYLLHNCLRNLFNIHNKNDLLKGNLGREVVEVSHLASSSGESHIYLCTLRGHTPETSPQPHPGNLTLGLPYVPEMTLCGRR